MNRTLEIPEMRDVEYFQRLSAEPDSGIEDILAMLAAADSADTSQAARWLFDWAARWRLD